MSLPKLKFPIFELTIPSTKQKINFRPFLVKEEKILLIAQQSGDDKAIVFAIKQIINNCFVEKINLDNLASVDLEYIFIKMRAKSVNNVAKVTYLDAEDDKKYSFEINLDNIEVIEPSTPVNSDIQIDEKTGLRMKFPTVKITESLTGDTQLDLTMDLIKKCIDVVYDENTVYPFAENSEAEKNEFLDNLSIQVYQKINEFLEGIPKIEHIITYTNSKGTERKITLRGIRDFFTWG